MVAVFDRSLVDTNKRYAAASVVVFGVLTIGSVAACFVTNGEEYDDIDIKVVRNTTLKKVVYTHCKVKPYDIDNACTVTNIFIVPTVDFKELLNKYEVDVK